MAGSVLLYHTIEMVEISYVLLGLVYRAFGLELLLCSYNDISYSNWIGEKVTSIGLSFHHS